MTAGHGDQRGDALRPQGHVLGGLGELGLGMNRQVPGEERQAGQQHGERDGAGDGHQFVFPHILFFSLSTSTAVAGRTVGSAPVLDTGRWIPPCPPVGSATAAYLPRNESLASNIYVKALQVVGDSRPVTTTMHGKSINDRLGRGIGCRF